jgi:phosphatidylinositol N-acetylglucosaminyltransferase subunit A
VLRERITLIHAHASLSSLGHEGILHAHLMGVRTVFTDHSLFGFEDAASILTNKLLEATLKNVDAVICVSHTGCVCPASALFNLLINIPPFRRENTVLRGQLFEPSEMSSTTLSVNANVYVIPNALVAEQFQPLPIPLPSDAS